MNANIFSSKVFQAAILGVSIIVAALIVSAAAGRFLDQRRYVSVKGLSEKEFPADVVVWPIVLKDTGDDLQLLSKTVSEKSDLVTKFLLEKGLTKDEISASVPEIIDLKTDRFSSGQENQKRYIITNVLTVNSTQVDKVRGIMSQQIELLKQGVAITSGDYQYTTIYKYTKLNDVKVMMIEEAAANARASAEQFAKDSKSKLGKIKDAAQGQISIVDRDPNTPFIKQIRVVSSVAYFLED